MELDDKLYRAFLEEMHALEDFRMTYASEHPTTPIEREDPDVKRLTEAMAIFAARTRMAALTNLIASRRRIFRQFLPYLLSPAPSMGLVQAIPTGRFTDVAVLPRGAEIAMRTDGERAALFRVLRELRILPVTLGRLSAVTGPRGGVRMLFPFTTPYARNDDIGTVSLLVNYLNDFQASLRVLSALRQNVSRVSVSFDERVDDQTKGAVCPVRYGLEDGAAELAHPVERERLYFHFPQSELFLHFQVPAPPRNWTRFTLCVDIDPGWPKNLRLSREAFVLFAAPVINLQRAMASPILHDGTKEAYPVRHPTLADGYELHSLRGVYRIDGGTMVPLRSAALGSGAGSYDLEDDPTANGLRRPLLHLHWPSDFQGSSTISVDAEWHQPWFDEASRGKVAIQPYRHSFLGLDWGLVGDFVAHHEPDFARETDDFTHLLVLQNKSVMGKEDLVALLGVLGAWRGPFAPLKALFEAVEVREVAQSGVKAGMKLAYWLRFATLDPTMQPLAETFAVHLGKVLDAWIADAPVEVRMGSAT